MTESNYYAIVMCTQPQIAIASIVNIYDQCIQKNYSFDIKSTILDSFSMLRTFLRVKSQVSIQSQLYRHKKDEN